MSIEVLFILSNLPAGKVLLLGKLHYWSINDLLAGKIVLPSGKTSVKKSTTGLPAGKAFLPWLIILPPSKKTTAW